MTLFLQLLQQAGKSVGGGMWVKYPYVKVDSPRNITQNIL